jgi:hypothetical protein
MNSLDKQEQSLPIMQFIDYQIIAKSIVYKTIRSNDELIDYQIIVKLNSSSFIIHHS